MTSVGSLVFCTDCGNLLPATTTSKKTTITCDVCGATNKDTSSRRIAIKSKPTDYPSALRNKHSQVQAVTEKDVQQGALTNETCDKCGNREVRYYTQQLRSADEGSTVFYTCTKCGHKWNTNN